MAFGRPDRHSLPKEQFVAHTYVTAAGATLAAHALSYPFDTLRRRMIILGPEIRRYRSTVAYVATVVESQGAMVFFKGFALNMVHRLAVGGVVLAALLRYPDAAFAFEGVVR
jgi:hypothetical protein